MDILLRVAFRYVTEVCRERKMDTEEYLLPTAHPYNIVARRCSLCGKSALDDAFASYAKVDPRTYIVFYHRAGCGRPGCGETFA